MPNKQETRFVATSTDLKALCAALEGAQWLALDTEFQREKTFYPQLCLIQIATEDLVACVDPLVNLDLAPLLALLSRSDIVKVFHAGRQDLEIFFHLLGHTLGPVFDTQIAAPLLGFPEQIGYSNLVERVLNVRLAKAYTRADWTLRPLPSEQLEYAKDDVSYLAKLYVHIHRELSARGRLDWLSEDFAALLAPSLYDLPPEQAWIRLGGIDRLDGSRLAIVQGLATWREQTARTDNVPRTWVVRDETLLDIAAMAPMAADALHRIRGISERSLRRYGTKIVEVVQNAKKQKPQAVENDKRSLRLNPKQEALVDCLSALVRLCAQEQALASSVIASRKDLERLVTGDRDLPVCKGWRASLVWHKIEAFLQGQIALHIQAGDLSLTSIPD